MDLSYRSVDYKQKPSTLEITEGEIIGKYRGQAWRYHYPKHIPQLKPKIYLQYRGVAYSIHAMPKVHSHVTTAEDTQESKTICPVPIKRKYKAIDRVSKIHLENMRRSLERRMQIAKARGDAELIKLLEKESQQVNYQTSERDGTSNFSKSF